MADKHPEECMTEEEERVIAERMGEIEEPRRHNSTEDVAEYYDIDLE